MAEPGARRITHLKHERGTSKECVVSLLLCSGASHPHCYSASDLIHSSMLDHYRSYKEHGFCKIVEPVNPF